MSFTIKKEGEIVVVDVEGQLIVGNRQELKQKVLDELERGEKKFLIDFAQTGYIDSSGLGVLVSLSKKIREQGGELRLANLNDDLKTIVVYGLGTIPEVGWLVSAVADILWPDSGTDVWSQIASQVEALIQKAMARAPAWAGALAANVTLRSAAW